MSSEWLIIAALESDPAGIWILIPLAAIAAVVTIIVVKSVIRHRERMAKIGMGMDPDYDYDSNAPSGSFRRPHDPTSQVGG